MPSREVVGMMPDNFTEPFTSEPTLRDPFGVAFRSPRDLAIPGASDVHVEIRSQAFCLDEPPRGNADFMFVYDNKLTGITELKIGQKVTLEQIAEVKAGTNSYTVYSRLFRRKIWHH